MTAAVGTLALGLLLAGGAFAAVNPEGAKCGEKRCSADEYCSPYDNHCKLCSSICDAAGRNYQPLECASDCQEYLHDKRYVLLEQYEELRGEIVKLWILVAVSFSVAVSSLLLTGCLFARKLSRWDKTRATVRRAFAGKWIKSTASRSAGDAANNNNNNNNNNSSSSSSSGKNRHRGTQDDAELGASKAGGLKLTMPTISASVAPSRHSANGSEGGAGIGNATPNTTTTSLSGRHPSEDTTLDYAYDNPAMTPSPESVQLRTKRESSF